MLTSTPSSPVYPQRVTLQSGTPNTVVRVEVMKVNLLRSSLRPSWSTRAMVGPRNIQIMNHLYNIRHEEWRYTVKVKIIIIKQLNQ